MGSCEKASNWNYQLQKYLIKFINEQFGQAEISSDGADEVTASLNGTITKVDSCCLKTEPVYSNFMLKAFI